MDYVRRLIFCLLISIPALTHAAQTYTPPMTYRILASLGGNGSNQGSVMNVCQGAIAALNNKNYAQSSSKIISVNTCTQSTSVNNAGNQEQYFDINGVYNVQTGSNITTTSWLAGAAAQTCTAPDLRGGTIPAMFCTVAACTTPKTFFDVATNTCILPPNCTAGQNDLNGDLFSGTCVNGCTHWTQGSGVYKRESSGVVWYVSLRANTGAACTTSSQSKVSADAAEAAATAQKLADATAAANAKTAADKAAAQAAATAAATAKSAADKAVADAKSAADKAAAVAADPNSTQAQKDAANAAATAAQSNADTKNAAAATAAGTAAATAKPDTPAETKDFCELHPTSFICKNSSVNKGSCSNGVLSGFSCEGDVSLCVIAQSEAENACLISSTDDALTNKYNEAKNDNPSNNPSLPQNATTINIPTALDDSSPYAGQCNPDTVISFNGASVTIPFSKWCDVLNALGYLFLACAYISAAIILGGAI